MGATTLHYGTPIVGIVGGAGTFLDFMDALHTACGSLTKWTIESTVGGAGAREVIELSADGGSLPDQRIAFAGKAAGAPLMQAPDTFLANAIHVGWTPVPGSTFVGATWATATPALWGASFTIPFSRFSAAVTFVEFVLTESDDDIWLVIKGSVPGWYGGRAGGWLRTPILSEGEGATYVLGGYQTSGSTAISSTWSTASNSWMNHGTTSGLPHSYVLQPGTATVWPVTRSVIVPAAGAGKIYDTTAGGNRLYRPIFYQHSTTFAPIGEARETVEVSGQYRTYAGTIATPQKYIVMAPSTVANVDGVGLLV